MKRLLPDIHASIRVQAVRRWRRGELQYADDTLLEEVPVAITCGERTLGVLMATPEDLEDLALGFALTEGVVECLDEVHGCHLREHQDGWVVTLDIPSPRTTRRREQVARSSCGLCGVAELGDALPPPPALPPAPVNIGPEALQRALAGLPERQRLTRLTGAAHACAWANTRGELLCLREDVGRHNALDKLIGALASQGVNPRSGFILATSRASVEMVQKTAAFGAPLLATVSAATALAVRYAEASGLVLWGFVRDGEAVCYTPHRTADIRG